MGIIDFKFSLIEKISLERNTEQRYRKLLEEIHNTCSHLDKITAVPDSDDAILTPALESPRGSLDYFCKYCQKRFTKAQADAYLEGARQRLEAEPAKETERLLRRQKKATRLIQRYERSGGPPIQQ